MNVKIFTDGACRKNPGPGGWAALLCFGEQKKEISGGELETTNNRMELKAVIKALLALKRPCNIDLYTDSKYVQLGMTKWIFEWKKKNWINSQKEVVKNADLWKELDTLAAIHKIHWHWVKSHSGHIENERVDYLARKAIGVT